MTVDWASLTFDALGLRTFADVPVRARLEYAGSAAAIEVIVGVWIVLSEACRHVVVHGELEKGSRGPWGDSGGDERTIPELTWYGKAGSDELLVEVEKVSGGQRYLRLARIDSLLSG